MPNPLVSIIIPVYNAERYLDACLNSAVNQTWPDKEIIIVDDGSTDHSLAIAKKQACKWIKVFYQQNKGASAARNKGLQEAKGDYIQFLDADDILSADKIEKQVLQLQTKPGYIAVCSTVHFADGANHLDCKPSAYEDAFLMDADAVSFFINLLGGLSNKGSMIQPNAWLVPNHIINKAGLWNEKITVDDDGEFFCRIILNSKGVVNVNGVFNYYRKHSDEKSLSAQKTSKDLNSRLLSAISKKEHLLSKTNVKEAQFAIYRQLYDIALSAYPTFPQLYKLAISNLPPGKFNYRPSIGGKIINVIAYLMGYKFARKMQVLLKK